MCNYNSNALQDMLETYEIMKKYYEDHGLFGVEYLQYKIQDIEKVNKS